MKLILKKKFIQEIHEYENASSSKDLEACIYHLGRAHIISQQSFFLHLYVHWIMFCFAFACLDFREVVGQVLRLLATLPGHLFRRLPKGNIGWSSVGLTEEMDIPEDILELMHPPESQSI